MLPAGDALVWPLRCSANPALNATALCTVCGAPFSGKFLGVRPDGRAVCFGCARREDIYLVSTGGGAGELGDPVLSQGWTQAAVTLLTRPYDALRDGHSGPIGGAVWFGLAATMFGFAATTAWDMALSGDAYIDTYLQLLADAGVTATRSELPALIAVSSLLSAPLRLFSGALLFHLGARAVAGREAQLRPDARVFALGSVALVLCGVPALGPLLSLLIWTSTAVAYLRQRYALGTAQSLVALLPSLLWCWYLGPRPFVEL